MILRNEARVELDYEEVEEERGNIFYDELTKQMFEDSEEEDTEEEDAEDDGGNQEEEDSDESGKGKLIDLKKKAI